MWLREKDFTIRLGGNVYIDTPVMVAFDGQSLFTVVRQEDGYLGIDFEVNSANGTKVASVKRNNIYLGDKDAYALEGEPERLRLISKPSNDALVDIRKNASSAPAELDVSVRSYLPDRRLMDLGPNTSNLGGIRMTGCVLKNCGIGIAVSSSGGVALCVALGSR